MKVTTNDKGNVGLWIVVLVVGLVIGFAVGRVMHKTTTTTSMKSAPSSTTAAATLRANLVTLGLEHMDLTDQAIDAALDGSPNAAATAAALYANGNTLGATVGSVYGASAQTTFDSVWKYHLDQFVDYAVADKEGNAAAKATALSNISSGYTIPLATYLSKAIPSLPESALQSGLAQHVSMTATMIDDHVAGNYTAEASELGSADTMIEGLFSTLAQGIVTSKPALF